jgi:hypothetical protein
VKRDAIVEADWEYKMVFQPIPASIDQDDQPSHLVSILLSAVSLPASLPTFSFPAVFLCNKYTFHKHFNNYTVDTFSKYAPVLWNTIPQGKVPYRINSVTNLGF